MKNYLPEELKEFKSISNEYDVYFIDLWGVIHNGLHLFDNAIIVLNELKKINKKVVLISNAPRSNATVKHFLKKLNFNLDLIDLLVTSGDVTKNYIHRNQNKIFYHLGPAKDNDLFKGIKNITNNINQFNEIICTGLVEEVGWNISDYESIFKNWIENEKTFICANPDEVVSRGNQIEFCAGALAKYYKKLGGKVLYFGKPYEEIYKFTKHTIEKNIENIIEKKKILAVGDNLKTDIYGAQNFNIDSLLILNGIYKDFFRDNNLNFDKLLKSNEMESLKINKFQQELNW
jgi:HAD superfamily hydrolase (TIGR01459 family)